MKKGPYFVYMLSNKTNSVIYTGVTNDLYRRIHEHKLKLHSGFTSKYNCNKLVYFEEYPDIKHAISREKQLKGGSRIKKTSLIIENNPKLIDLSLSWYQQEHE